MRSVVIAAPTSPNLSRVFKKVTMGLPISETTAAIAINIITACTLYKNQRINMIPPSIPSALRIPYAIILDLSSIKRHC